MYDGAMNASQRRNTSDDVFLDRDDALSFTVRVQGDEDTEDDRYHTHGSVRSLRSINPASVR
jgi:hypothetical protein